MSADLQFRLPILAVGNSSETSGVADDGVMGCVIEEEGEVLCRTPRSPQHRIPPAVVCPPAPKKPRRSAACKRKLFEELEFFEVLGREEVESLFGMHDEVKKSSNGSNKRKCVM